MISRMNKHCTVELQALPPRIGQVRRIVSAQLRYWHLDPLIDPAALGVTELLTNVHQHAEPDKRCTVEIDLVVDRLTVSVRDHDPRLPRVLEPDVASTHGRGLALVAAVSASWGVEERLDGGKVVWFTLPVPQCAPAASPRLVRASETTAVFEQSVLELSALEKHPLFGGPHPTRRPAALREPAPARSAALG
ncbi:ATP-binding protein [Streptomyces netropsis]|uniref:Anti-sigma regulatory factor (Ser/Thr protein kinase) n=1 Tax=Streptomyces netropsis TaxID=55404 RepID=A0A7W7L802_STRNE|nr:ATP-binding protein [Streptomyces netropsis]MBB4885097.1 anti-sigma regulatory factor (Ser/Thr protein kinase) [Streptomyces netropsis]GGR26748.1 ATPase [Streptomyces netropsis]